MESAPAPGHQESDDPLLLTGHQAQVEGGVVGLQVLLAKGGQERVVGEADVGEVAGLDDCIGVVPE
jgi:hypothetical protein